MLKAEVLGQLLLMQNVLISLPNKKSIFSFVCRGLSDLPGIEKAEFFLSKSETVVDNEQTIAFEISKPDFFYGTIQLKIRNFESYMPYEQYIRNFMFMVEVILDEKHQRQLIENHKKLLEKRVSERTSELQAEIERRKEKELALKKSEERYRLLFENMTTGFGLHEMIFDKHGNSIDYKFLHLNPAYEILVGISANEMLGKTAKEVFPEIELNWIETFGKVVRTSVPASYQSESKSLGKHFHSWTYPVEHNKFAVIFTDVTQKVLAEKELLENKQILQEQNEEYESLNEELRQTNEELVYAKEKAEEGNRLKTTFLGNISHEIRTPLNAIVGFSEFLDIPDLSDDKRKRFTKIIKESSNRLLEVVSDILTVSSLETKQEKSYNEEFSLHDLLLDTYAAFRKQAEAKNIALRAVIIPADKHLAVKTDKSKLNEILRHLLTNAIKFTDKGYVKFGYAAKDNLLQFYVKDTGIGIAHDMHQKIFEGFCQAGQKIQADYGGTGLGLTIAKGFTELLGGEIWLESKIGEGSVFYFTVPFYPVLDVSNTFDPQPQSKAKTLLVAEDEEFIYIYIEECLQDLGFNILHARNGQEAVDMCKSNPDISMVLMDIKMPVMDGYTAAEIIKKHNPALPIVAQSAYVLHNEIGEYNQVFDDYLTKPLNDELLKQKVLRYINKT